MVKKSKKTLSLCKTIFVISILVVLSLFPFAVSESKNSNGRIVVKYSFDIPHIKKVTIGGNIYDKVILSDTISTADIGEPCLPIKGAFILLPQNSKAGKIKVETGETVCLGSGFYVEPAGEPVPISMTTSSSPPEPNPEIYSSGDTYPDNLVTEIGTYRFRGYDILVLNLHPVQYVPSTGKLLYHSELTVTIETVENKDVSALFRGVHKDELEVIRRVDNPATIDTYIEKHPCQSNANGNYDLLILTSDSLKDCFVPLKEIHDTNGISTIIKTLSDVGKSDPESLRNYIRNAYFEWGIEYVLIGGDDDVVSAKTLWVFGLDEETDPYETYMPSDLYYACLDGPYNYDDDGKWGEPNDGSNGNDVDLIAEVYVGRAPVSDATEAENFVDKTISQINSHQNHDSYLKDFLLVGEKLGNYGIASWAGNYLDQLINSSTEDGYQTTGIPQSEYNVSTLYDRERVWSKLELMDLINGGLYVINHDGHSSYGYNMEMRDEDVYDLTNNKFCFIYSQGCMAGGFDNRDCIAESFTVKTKHGAFAGIWNARYGWFWAYSTDGDSQRFHREFWDAVFGEKIPEIGKANQDSKEDNLYLIGRSCMRWCYYELNLFGDPSLSFYYNRPDKPQTPSGPSYGEKGIEYIYTTRTTDPNDDQVFYKWDWGDGNFSEWFGPYESEEEVSASYNWSQGSYDVRVKAMDVNGEESLWSDPLPITMPRFKLAKPFFIRMLNKVITCFPLLEQLYKTF